MEVSGSNRQNVLSLCREHNVFGWTSTGFGLPSVIPWIGGHTEHLWGHVWGMVIAPADDGGAYLLRWGS